MVTTTGAQASPLDAVRQLQRVVEALAPTLRPQVLPKGVGYGLDALTALCATDEQRVELRALVQQHKPKDSDALEPFAVGAFDADKGVFSVEEVQWLGETDAIVHRFVRFLELQVDQSDDAKAVMQRFLEANGHAKEEVLVAEQCLNAAFALQTILRAFPRPPIAIKGEIVEITAKTDVAQAIAALFPSSSSAKKTKKAAASAGKSKKAKGKKRKSSDK